MGMTDSLETGTLESQLRATEALASGLTVVNHGATAGTARPTTHASVLWIGSVTPTNATEFDIYCNTGTGAITGFTA